MKFRNLLKVLNPFIWFLNFMSYQGHLDMEGMCAEGRRKRGEPYKYSRYNFNNDIKYF